MNDCVVPERSRVGLADASGATSSIHGSPALKCHTHISNECIIRPGPGPPLKQSEEHSALNCTEQEEGKFKWYQDRATHFSVNSADTIVNELVQCSQRRESSAVAWVESQCFTR